MGLVWNPLGAAGATTALVAWALAMLVLFARPDRRQNRYLAVMLAVEGAGAASGAGLIYLTDQANTAYAAQFMTRLSQAVLPFLYLLFLGTLPSRLARPFSGARARVLLGLGAVAAALVVVVFAHLFVAGVRTVPYAVWDGVSGPGTVYLRPGNLIVSSFGLLVAFSVWRGAPRGSDRGRDASAYLAAFAVRDLGLGANMFLRTALYTGLGLPPVVALATQYAYTPLALLFYALLAYGILRRQLFGIDLRVKWTLRRGTVVAALAAGFFVVKETLEFLLPLDGLAPSLAGAAAIGLLTLPAWRLAGRLADGLMPGVENTDEYRTVRRREVYQAALEETLVDGELTSKDRAVLAALQDHLGLTAREANAIERNAARPRGVA